MSSADPLRQHCTADSTASSLLSASRRGDPQAWDQLVERYSALVYHWCREAGCSAEDSADLLQTVMFKVAQHLSRFEKDGRPAAFRRWLATITRNSITDFARADHGQPHGLGGTDALHRLQRMPAPRATDSSSGGHVTPRHGHLEPLLQAVEETVEARTWEAFRLTVLGELSSVEAGEQLGMSPAAVRLAKARVLQRLRNELSSDSVSLNGGASE